MVVREKIHKFSGMRRLNIFSTPVVVLHDQEEGFAQLGVPSEICTKVCGIGVVTVNVIPIYPECQALVFPDYEESGVCPHGLHTHFEQNSTELPKFCYGSETSAL